MQFTAEEMLRFEAKNAAVLAQLVGGMPHGR